MVLLFVHGWHHNAAWNPSTNSGDEYFGTALPLLPDRTYAHESDYHPYRLIDVTNVLDNK